MKNGWKKIKRACANPDGSMIIYYEDGSQEKLSKWSYLNID